MTSSAGSAEDMSDLLPPPDAAGAGLLSANSVVRRHGFIGDDAPVTELERPGSATGGGIINPEIPDLTHNSITSTVMIAKVFFLAETSGPRGGLNLPRSWNLRLQIPPRVSLPGVPGAFPRRASRPCPPPPDGDQLSALETPAFRFL